MPAHAVELKPRTEEAFERYVRATEAQLAQEARDSNLFLWIDREPESRRRALYAQLQQGQVVIQHLNTREEGKPIAIPEGLIHHWAGVIFIPGTTLAKTLDAVQDYGHGESIYKPYVRQSKLLSREGNEFKVYLQLYRKTLVTAVFNVEYDVRFFQDDATRVHSVSHSTRLAEVENFGERDERELPSGKDHGYLWRLNSYWRFEEKDGGVYVQVESLALSRTVPTLLGWLVNPLLKKIPRETIAHTLNATRIAVTARSDVPVRAN